MEQRLYTVAKLKENSRLENTYKYNQSCNSTPLRDQEKAIFFLIPRKDIAPLIISNIIFKLRGRVLETNAIRVKDLGTICKPKKIQRNKLWSHHS